MEVAEIQAREVFDFEDLDKRTRAEAIDATERFRDTLRRRHAPVWDKRIAAPEPVTLEALGEELGITRERVRQIEAQIIWRCAQFMRRQAWGEFGVHE